MLCTLVAQPFNDDQWIFEPKYDGLRVVGVFDGQSLTLLSRNEQAQNFQFPDIVAALQANLRYPAVVDGEVVCFDEEGRTSFRVLQQRFHLKDAGEVQQRMQEYPAYLHLFDILYIDHYDVTALPLEKRKDLLREAVDWSEHVRWTPMHEGNAGVRLFRQACREHAEGIVGKRRDSLYVGGRSDAWVKIKCLSKQEFVIAGFTDPQRSRVGLGALLVGYYSDDGKQLVYAGKVGTGFTHEMLLDLRARLDLLVQRVSPFSRGGAPHGENVHWVKPRLVAEIAFSEWTQHGLLRQPRFEGLRPDKNPKECHRERPRRAPPNHTQANHRLPVTAEKGASAMALETYKAKRNFRVTPEPGPEKAASHARTIFVIQEHHASRLHYDFRLEADGVLKSWAVPKQPSLDPADKRLAVHVEDHPLGYASFKGRIPEGQYGAGTVKIWDKGTYENQSTQGAKPVPVAKAIEAGRLEFELHGKKLKGRFALIRMKNAQPKGKDNWLLIKMRDEFARSANGQSASAAARAEPQRRPAARSRAKAKSSQTDGTFPFTHTDKILFPDSGITKGDVLLFYSRIAPRLLPFLRDRPVTLERLPEGLRPDGPRFWQKDTPSYYPKWIPRIDLETERGKTVHYTLVNSLQALLYLVNQGALTFHTWLSRVQDLDRPDFVLFDLDPGPAAFSEVVAVALALQKRLNHLRRRAFVKTTGKTGLHVLVPWQEKGGYDEARAWSRDVAEQLAAEMPEMATTEIRKAKRGRRVYVDTMQNARGHHAVPPYVLRAVPAATVSLPLSWKELTPELDPGQFTIKTVLRRLARQKKDPFAPLVQSFEA